MDRQVNTMNPDRHNGHAGAAAGACLPAGESFRCSCTSAGHGAS
jgi:hypothetical protein